jgi:hypothetical protein
MFKWDNIKNISGALATLSVFATVIFGVIKFIDWRIDQRIHSEETLSYIDRRVDKSIASPGFIGKVRHNIKPTAIFNIDGSVIADMGAMGYISDIKVEKEKYKGSNKIFKVKIIITPKELLNVAPMLEALDGNYNIATKRGHKYDWIYDLRPVIVIVTEESDQTHTHAERFRIEILN